MGKTRVLIVDDHPIFRKGLAQIINDEKDMCVSGEAADVSGAIEEIEKNTPDMVIIDISLKEISGFELIKYIKRNIKDLPLLVLSMHEETLYAKRVIKAGAQGYIMKHEVIDKVAAAIREVKNGKYYLSGKMNYRIINNIIAGIKNPEEPLMSELPVILSDRELEIFTLLGKGFKRNEISKKLSLNNNTVGTYRERIKEKLSIETTSEMIALAVQWVQGRIEK